MFAQVNWFLPVLISITDDHYGYQVSGKFSKHNVYYINISNNHYYFKGAGKDVGLDILLSPDIDEYVSPIRPYEGIQISLHHPLEFPDSKHLIVIEPGFDYRFFVTPYVLSADEEVIAVKGNSTK